MGKCLPWNKQKYFQTLPCGSNGKTCDGIDAPEIVRATVFYGYVDVRTMSLNEAANAWLSKLKDANKTFLIQDGQYFRNSDNKISVYSNLLEHHNIY